MLTRRGSVFYWALFAAWQATGFWLIFGPLVLPSQRRHEYLGLNFLTPGDMVAGLSLMGTDIPEPEGLLLGSLTILLVNYLLAFGLWRLLLARAVKGPRREDHGD